MRSTRFCFGLLTGLLVAAPVALAARPTPIDPQVKQGEYLYRAAGCEGCHTDTKHGGKRLSGGHALATPFGWSLQTVPGVAHTNGGMRPAAARLLLG